MKDLVLKPEQAQAVLAYLNDQPHKFSAPLVAFFNQLIAEQNPLEAATVPAAPEEVE